MATTAQANPGALASSRTQGPAASSSPFFAMGRADPMDASIRVVEFGHIEKMMWEANILYGEGRVEDFSLAPA